MSLTYIARVCLGNTPCTLLLGMSKALNGSNSKVVLTVEAQHR